MHVQYLDNDLFCIDCKPHVNSVFSLEMTEVEPVLDFASSGRSGRRNALPDILGSPVGVPPDLSLKLAELSLTGNFLMLCILFIFNIYYFNNNENKYLIK